MIHDINTKKVKIVGRDSFREEWRSDFHLKINKTTRLCSR